MANTWRVTKTGISYAANAHLLDLYNAVASARVIRIYRAYLFNNGTSAVTGVLNTARINTLNTGAPSGGTAVTPIAHNLGNSALDANTTAGTGRTCTVEAIIRQLLHSPDEPAVTTLDWDAVGTLVPYAEWWNAGYGDSNVQPITCRAAETRGFSIQSITQTVGTSDCEIEFTDAAS